MPGLCAGRCKCKLEADVAAIRICGTFTIRVEMM